MSALRRVVAAFALAATGAVRAECLGFDEPVTLEGTIVYETFFGPPDYGEDPQTDALETQAILKLWTPVCSVAADTHPGVADQREVTLVPGSGVHFANGQRVRVRGGLFVAHTGHHHTPLLLSVESLEPWEGRKARSH
jgi:hypothetical protein